MLQWGGGDLKKNHSKIFSWMSREHTPLLRGNPTIQKKSGTWNTSWVWYTNMQGNRIRTQCMYNNCPLTTHVWFEKIRLSTKNETEVQNAAQVVIKDKIVRSMMGGEETHWDYGKKRKTVQGGKQDKTDTLILFKQDNMGVNLIFEIPCQWLERVFFRKHSENDGQLGRIGLNSWNLRQ